MIMVHRPSIQAIETFFKKFEEIGSGTDIRRSAHHRFTHSISNIATVGESVG